MAEQWKVDYIKTVQREMSLTYCTQCSAKDFIPLEPLLILSYYNNKPQCFYWDRKIIHIFTSFTNKILKKYDIHLYSAPTGPPTPFHFGFSSMYLHSSFIQIPVLVGKKAVPQHDAATSMF